MKVLCTRIKGTIPPTLPRGIKYKAEVPKERLLSMDLLELLLQPELETHLEMTWWKIVLVKM
jgi:hypothetical protein